MFSSWPPPSKEEIAKNNLLEVKRERANERRRKLLDSKQRTIGQDVSEIDRQVNEKAEIKRQEILEQKAYEANEQRVAEYKLMAERKKNIDRKNLDLETAAHWGSQNKKLSDTWDLQDKNIYNEYVLTDERPFVIEEDLKKRNEERRQKQQLQTDYITEQLREKDMIKQEEDDYTKRHAEISRQQFQIRKQVEEKESLSRLQQNVDVFHENQRLHNLRQRRNEYEKDLDKQRGEMHVQTQLANPLLKECRTKEVGIFGKPVRYEWKGMNPHEIEEIRKEQARQVEEKAQILEEERQIELAHNAQEERIWKKRIEIEEAAQAERLKNNLKYKDHHKLQKDAAQVKKEEEIHHRLKPGISEEWWPFGKNDR